MHSPVVVPDNRRGTNTEVTDAGREVLTYAQPIHDEALAKARNDGRVGLKSTELVDHVRGQ